MAKKTESRDLGMLMFPTLRKKRKSLTLREKYTNMK